MTGAVSSGAVSHSYRYACGGRVLEAALDIPGGRSLLTDRPPDLRLLLDAGAEPSGALRTCPLPVPPVPPPNASRVLAVRRAGPWATLAHHTGVWAAADGAGRAWAGFRPGPQPARAGAPDARVPWRRIAASWLADLVIILSDAPEVIVLHAAAVALPASAGGSGVALIGASGSGKTTTAAALHRAGFHWAADDFLRVRLGPGGWRLFPAWPARTPLRGGGAAGRRLELVGGRLLRTSARLRMACLVAPRDGLAEPRLTPVAAGAVEYCRKNARLAAHVEPFGRTADPARNAALAAWDAAGPPLRMLETPHPLTPPAAVAVARLVRNALAAPGAKSP